MRDIQRVVVEGSIGAPDANMEAWQMEAHSMRVQNVLREVRIFRSTLKVQFIRGVYNDQPVLGARTSRATSLFVAGHRSCPRSLTLFVLDASSLLFSFESLLDKTVAIHSSNSSSACVSSLPVPSTPNPPLSSRLASDMLLISRDHIAAPLAINATLSTLIVAILSASRASMAPLVFAAWRATFAGASV